MPACRRPGRLLVMKDIQPPLYGLVLAGGLSERMGADKGLLNYRGKPHREWLADQLAPLCEQVFISCRPEQVAELPQGYRGLPDRAPNLGPAGGLLSAAAAQPGAAWMAVACDLPLLDADTLAVLIEARDTSADATAFFSPYINGPDPLAAIWEPTALALLADSQHKGPFKTLRSARVRLIHLDDASVLANVNTPGARAEAQARLKKP